MFTEFKPIYKSPHGILFFAYAKNIGADQLHHHAGLSMPSFTMTW